MYGMDKKVVLMKTHIWNDDIEKFASKIFHETTTHGIDFFVLMHAENDYHYNKIKSDHIRNVVHKFKEADIRKIYPNGFFSMWLSNHWILMWFYQKFKDRYQYFWSVEYDVRISGNSYQIWSYTGNEDFLHVMGNHRNSKNIYNNYYVGGKLAELEKYHGFLQIARYSNNALAYLDKCFNEGENGQDELIIFSLLNRGGFIMSKKFLQSLVRGMWTWEERYNEYNRKLYNQFESKKHNHLFIFHPVK